MKIFTFGYNSRFSSILRSLVAIAVGLLMIFSTDATATLVKIVAALLFSAGAITLVYGLVQKKKGYKSLMFTNAVVDVVIGLILFLNPGIVGSAIVGIIGVVLVILGIMQVVALYRALSQLGGSFVALLLSAFAVLLGLFLIFSPLSEAIMKMLAGAALIYYGVTELMSAWKVDQAVRDYEIKFKEERETHVPEDGPAPTDLDDVKDIEYHRIDDQ